MKSFLLLFLISATQVQAADIGIKQALYKWAEADSVSFTIEYLAGKDDAQGCWARIQVPATALPVPGETGEQAQRRLEQGVPPLLVIPSQDRRTWHLIDRRLVGRSPCDTQVTQVTFDGYASDLVQELVTSGKIPGVTIPTFFAVSGGQADVGTGPKLVRQRVDGRLRNILTETYSGTGMPDPAIQWIAESRIVADGSMNTLMLFTGGKPKK